MRRRRSCAGSPGWARCSAETCAASLRARTMHLHASFMRRSGRAKARGAGRRRRRVFAPAAQGFPRCSGAWPCGVTRFAPCGRCAQTGRRKSEIRSALRAPASHPARLGCAHACAAGPPPAPSPRQRLTAEEVGCGEGNAVDRTRRARSTNASDREACDCACNSRIAHPDARVARPIVTRSGRWWRGGGDVCGAERGWFGLGARSALRTSNLRHPVRAELTT